MSSVVHDDASRKWTLERNIREKFSKQRRRENEEQKEQWREEASSEQEKSEKSSSDSRNLLRSWCCCQLQAFVILCRWFLCFSLLFIRAVHCQEHSAWECQWEIKAKCSRSLIPDWLFRDDWDTSRIGLEKSLESSHSLMQLARV